MGPMGFPGDKGHTGAPGEKGEKGIQGVKGETGSEGVSGVAGFPGEMVTLKLPFYRNILNSTGIGTTWISRSSWFPWRYRQPWSARQ